MSERVKHWALSSCAVHAKQRSAVIALAPTLRDVNCTSCKDELDASRRRTLDAPAADRSRGAHTVDSIEVRVAIIERQNYALRRVMIQLGEAERGLGPEPDIVAGEVCIRCGQGHMTQAETDAGEQLVCSGTPFCTHSVAVSESRRHRAG